jgi:hypothetical protein
MGRSQNSSSAWTIGIATSVAADSHVTSIAFALLPAHSIKELYGTSVISSRKV